MSLVPELFLKCITNAVDPYRLLIYVSKEWNINEAEVSSRMYNCAVLPA